MMDRFSQGYCPVGNNSQTRHTRSSDGTTSHSTRLPKDSSQVADYPVTGEGAIESLREFHVNGHAPLASTPNDERKYKRGAILTEVAKIFGALTPHVNVTRVANSYPQLLPLSTYSKKAILRFRSSGYFGYLSVLYFRAATSAFASIIPTCSCMGVWGFFLSTYLLSQ